MKKLYKFLVVIALVCSSFVAKAQNDGVIFTLLPQLPYVNYYNPGIRVPYNGVIGFGISNIGVSVYNSSIKYSNIYTTNAAGEDVIDAAKFINSLDDQDNVFNFNFSMDILNIGVRYKKMFFSFDWRARIGSDFVYSKDFLGFFVLGNGHYLGQDNPCDFNVQLDVNAFAEYGIGFQYDVNEKLTVGIRPKLLSGIASVTADNQRTKIFTDENTYAMSADVNLDVKVSSIFKSELYRIGDISKMFDSVSNGTINASSNLGLGIDFGASYVHNEHWGVAAGVYDLGYIKWKNAKVKHVEKTAVTLNDAVYTDINDIYTLKLDYKGMLDQIVDEVWGNDSLVDGSDYKTYLKTRIMAQGYYQFNPMLRFTGIAQFYAFKGKVKPAFTLAYSGLFLNHLNLALSYTMSNYTGNALGTGLGLHFGAFNFYVVSDNILAMFKTASYTEEFATSYQSAGARLGVVFTIGKYHGTKKVEKVKEEKEYIEDMKVDTEKIDKEKEEFEQQQKKQ
ncbi:MAG: hypothetical protein IKS65_07100 [Bacteroidales bacterium]|nr:hypothetical protein [Bacteroidales bacterium]